MPGSSIHGILQARILERVAISFSRGSSRPRDQTQVSCIAGRFLTTEPPGRPLDGEVLAMPENPYPEGLQLGTEKLRGLWTTATRRSLGNDQVRYLLSYLMRLHKQ